MKKIQSIHFVGIKGVGMAPLAIVAKEAGFKVSGCDIGEEFITDAPLAKAGIIPKIGFSPSHIVSSTRAGGNSSGNSKVDLVITTGAHGGLDNPEVKFAKAKNIPVLTQGQAVGEFMQGDMFGRSQIGISVTGSHGKTTSTSIPATLLKESGMDPSFVVGTGDIPSLGSNGHFGKGKYFIAEADEYATEPVYDKTTKFLWQHPKIAIFTNIELDHTDLYPSLVDVHRVFLQFAKSLSPDSVLVAYGGDQQIQKLIKEYHGRVITYGYTKGNDYILKKISVLEDQTFFWVDAFGNSMGEFVISIPGEHNALNAVGALIAALEAGVGIENIKKGMIAFKGSKRRFEYVGKLASGALLYDDYAHHPTEIKKTLSAFRIRFPKSKIVCIFQPHTYSRTKSLFEDFSTSFSNADTVAISNIYSSLREEPDLTVSSQALVLSIKRFHKDALFLPELLDVIKYIEQKQFGKDTVVITMGAGDIYKVNQKLKISSKGQSASG